MTSEELFSGNILIFDPPLYGQEGIEFFNILSEYLQNVMSVDYLRGIDAVVDCLEDDQYVFYVRFTKEGNNFRMRNYSDEDILELEHKEYIDKWVKEKDTRIITVGDIFGYDSEENLFDKLNESEIEKDNGIDIRKHCREKTILLFEPPLNSNSISLIKELVTYLKDTDFRHIVWSLGSLYSNTIKDNAIVKYIRFHMLDTRFYVNSFSVSPKDNPEDRSDFESTLDSYRETGFKVVDGYQLLGGNVADLWDKLNENEESKDIKVGDKAYCHTDLVMNEDGNIEAYEGKSYEIIRDSRYRIFIKNESGDEHEFEKSGEDDYKNWFTIIPAGIDPKEIFDVDFFGKLDENKLPFDPHPDAFEMTIWPPRVGDYLYCIQNVYAVAPRGTIEREKVCTEGNSYKIVFVMAGSKSFGDHFAVQIINDKNKVQSYISQQIKAYFKVIPKEVVGDIESFDPFKGLNENLNKMISEEIKDKPSIGRKVYLIMHASGKFVIPKTITFGVYWIDIDNDYGSREYEEYSNIVFRKEESAKEFLRHTISSNEGHGYSAYKLRADYRDKFIPEEWEVVEYTLGLIPQTNMFENDGL